MNNWERGVNKRKSGTVRFLRIILIFAAEATITLEFLFFCNYHNHTLIY